MLGKLCFSLFPVVERPALLKPTNTLPCLLLPQNCSVKSRPIVCLHFLLKYASRCITFTSWASQRTHQSIEHVQQACAQPPRAGLDIQNTHQLNTSKASAQSPPGRHLIDTRTPPAHPLSPKPPKPHPFPVELKAHSLPRPLAWLYIHTRRR